MLTPLHLDILLHAFTSTPWKNNTEISTHFVAELQSAGLMQLSNDGLRHEITAKGRAHVSQICSLPFPTLEWVSATKEVIDLS